jgi:acyl carrier protein
MTELAAARDLVAAALELPADEVPADSDVETLPAWDSLGHVRVILALEAALARTLTSGELAQVRSIADVGRLLRGRGA